MRAVRRLAGLGREQPVEEEQILAALLVGGEHELLHEGDVADAVLDADDARVAHERADRLDRELRLATVVQDDGQLGGSPGCAGRRR